MNAAAFRRGEAITRLENYAPVIVEHLALVTWFPTNTACKHWQYELGAFRTRLRRFDTGKGAVHNFNHNLIVDVLMGLIVNNEDRDYLVIDLESHGLIVPENPDWESLKAAMHEFAESLLK